MKRLIAFDYLRVLLILLVIIFHSVVFVTLSNHVSSFGQTIDQTMDFSQWIAHLAISTNNLLQGVFYSYLFIMPAFFLLAGFFARLTLNKLGTKKFIVNRAMKIAVPFLFLWLWKAPLYFLLIAWVYFFATGFGAILLLSVQSLLQQAGGNWSYLNDLSYTWFLYDLLWLYAISVGLMCLVERWQWLRQSMLLLDRWLLKVFVSPLCHVLIAGVCTLLLARHFAAGVLPFDGRLNSPLALGLFYALWYGVGWWLAAHQSQFSNFFNYNGVKLSLSMVLYGIYMQYFFSPSAVGFSYYIGLFINQLSTVFVVFSLIGLTWRYGTKPRYGLRYVSAASYWLYLSHIPLIFLCLTWLPQQAAHYYVDCVVVSVTTLALGLLSYQWLVRHTWLNRFVGEKYSDA